MARYLMRPVGRFAVAAVAAAVVCGPLPAVAAAGAGAGPWSAGAVVQAVAPAALSLQVTNRVPMTDPRTSKVIDLAGVVGDTLDLVSPGLSGSVTVRFTGAGDVAATPVAAGAWSVVVPPDARPGVITAVDGLANTAVSDAFAVWPSRSEPYVMPDGHLNVTLEDLQFILDQIKMGEAHADRTRTAGSVLAPSGNAPSATIRFPYDLTSPNRCLTAADVLAAGTTAYGPTYLSNVYTWTNIDPLGLRQVDGACNNITNVMAEPAPTTGFAQSLAPGDTSGWGAADQPFTRSVPGTLGATPPYTLSTTQQAYQNPGNWVKDPTGRLASNLVSDQSVANAAAQAASQYSFSTLYGSSATTTNAINATTGDARSVYEIPNVTADYNVSAGYDSWFTLFGQFFDHGLDLIPKGGSSVFLPLLQDDPLYVASPSAPNFMVLTRGATADGESLNSTSPYVDQSQAYGSHPSQNFFVREYTFAPGTGVPSSNGRLVESTDEAYTVLPTAWLANRTVGGSLTHATGDVERANGGVPTWRDIKAQARLLGFELTDHDARSIPIVATDQYGRFTPGPTGMPMMLFSDGTQYVWAWGSAASPVGTGAKTAANPSGGTTLPGQTGSTWVAVSSGHAFINDTMATAVPFASNGTPLAPDADLVMNSVRANTPGYYDDETLAAHYVAGDGRINENIALSAVHHAFHSEHNTVLADIGRLLADHPLVTAAFRSEWNGERLYQAARLVNEMEYQHVAYDEFVRRIAPNLPVFLQYNANVNPAITQEFASAVYRLGHSMLNETLARSNPGSFYDPANNQDVALIEGFTNPAQVRLRRPAVVHHASRSGSAYTYTLANDEIAPEAGAVVTITGMDDPAFDISNAVVDARSGTSFTVSTRYPGGSATIASGLPATGSTSAQSRTASTDGALLAKVQTNDPGPSGWTWSPGTAAASVAQGMSSQRGNEIDEFVTDSVRNNLLGLPLDLATLNITRGRDTGLPTLNQFRAKNAASLYPYTSWSDFIANLRYPESGVNFVAAYGTHPSLRAPVTVGAVSAASAVVVSGSELEITYAMADTSAIHATDVVSISGLSGYNVTNAVVRSVSASSITVRTAWAHSPSAVLSFPSAAALMADVPAAVTGVAGSATPTGASGSVTREPNTAEKRSAAGALLAATNGEGYEFVTSTGAWASVESGLNAVDLWLGGLAENPAKQPLTPPMLGPTFQFVFQDQMLRLQDGDRFYYLGRLMGRNIGEEIPAQKLTDIVRRNTPSAGPDRTVAAGTGLLGMNSPGFGIADCAFANPVTLVPSGPRCASGTMRTDALSGTLTHNGLDNVTGFGDPQAPGLALAGGAGDDAIFGSRGNDRLSGGISGGDLVDGYAGSDIILGGPGEDLLKGGPGHDVIDAGESQAGDTVDGGSGSDWLHCGQCQGAIASFIGEAGNDFVQGGRGSDLVLEGGEGDDWVEGLGGGDFLFGDSGLAGAGAILGGGNDVLWSGEGIDFASGDSGEDVIEAGDSGIDAIDGGLGFDWVTYEHIVRFDNGPAAKPGVWIDLSGVNPNPLNKQGDAVLAVEGVSGGPGNDVIIDSLMTDVTVPYAVGVAGSTTLVIQGTWTQIADGMIAQGPGISPYAVVVGPAAIATVNGVTTSTVDLNVPLTANVAGPVTFLSWQVRNPRLIDGLEPLLVGTPGWRKYTGADPNARLWSGGNILLGGPGNDRFRITGGEGVVHGGAMLHACLLVVHNGTRYTAGADTTCSGGPGYTSMTLLNAAMNAGTVTPTDVRIVRELQFLSPTDAAAAQDVLELPGPSTDYVFIPISPLPAGTTSGFTVYGPNGHPATVYDVALVKFGMASPVSMATTRSTLAGLVLNPGTLTPSFTTGVLNYSATVPTATSSVTVAPTVTYGGATVTVNGGAVISGLASPSISLVRNAVTRVSVVVTAPGGGQTSTYVLDISRASAVPTFDTPVSTASGFTVNLTNYSSANTYTYTLTAGTVTVGRASGSKLALTVTGLAPGGSAVLQANVSRPGYVSNSGSVAGSSLGNAALVPTFDAPVANSTGFTVNITDYDPAFTWTATPTAGVATMGVAVGGIRPLTVSGLTAGQTATVTVTTSRTGNGRGSATVTGTATALPALTPTFTAPVGNATGFTTNVTNYDPAFTWTVTTSLGVVTVGTASGTTLPLTVTGLTAGQTATVTVTTTRSGYTTGTANVTGTAPTAPALVPTFSTPVPTGTGFTFNVTNYNSAWIFGESTNLGIVTVGKGSGTLLPVTVTGLAPSQSATVTVTTRRSGYPVGSGSVTGTSPLAPLTPTFGTPLRALTSYTVRITNYDPAWTWAYKVSNGKVTVGTPSGSTVTVTVTGLKSTQTSTLTVTARRSGYTTGTSSITR